MTEATEIPAHLRRIVDEAAGREHSAGGAVMRCLAEVLGVHEKDVLRTAAAKIRSYSDPPDDWAANLIDPDKDETP